MKFIHQMMHFLQFCFPVTLWCIVAQRCANQNILWRMGKIDKFQELCFIAAVFQQIAADGIGGQRRANRSWIIP